MRLDEKWSFVGKKQKSCDPDSRLVLSRVAGRRITESAAAPLGDVKARQGGRAPAVVAGDEYPAYAEALLAVFGGQVTPPRTGKPGRPAGPRVEPPAGACCATVHEGRRKGRVASAEARGVFGAQPAGESAGTSHLER